jgi:hypothetical protein
MSYGQSAAKHRLGERSSTIPKGSTTQVGWKWEISLRSFQACLCYNTSTNRKGKTMTEIYKDIQGYETLYQVSNLGNVKSLPKGDGNGNRERLLKLEVIKRDHTSYYRVTLSKDGNVRRFQVHQLVAKAFIPNPENKPHVNHIDNNGLNNLFTNLEWCTAAENMAHSANQGRQNEVRKLGGQAIGKLKHDKALLDASQLIGTSYGRLTVLEVFYDETLAKPRIKYKCQCSCGNTTEKNKYDLLNKTQACRDCTYKIRAATRKSNKDKDIVSSI